MQAAKHRFINVGPSLRTADMIVCCLLRANAHRKGKVIVEYAAVVEWRLSRSKENIRRGISYSTKNVT